MMLDILRAAVTAGFVVFCLLLFIVLLRAGAGDDDE